MQDLVEETDKMTFGLRLSKTKWSLNCPTGRWCREEN